MSGAVERFVLPVALALVVHVIALYGLLRTYSPDVQDLVAPPEAVVQATLVEMQARAQPAKRQPIVVVEQAPRPRPPARPQPAPKPASKPPEPAAREAEAKPQVAPDARAREARDALQALQQAALDDALDAELEALAAADDESVAASYIGRIRQAVQSQWIPPPSARNGMQVVLLVELVPTGEVVGVSVVRSSGSEAFDRSAVAAVNKARRFEVPPERELFERVFRRFRFLFNPEDLLR